MDKLNVHQLKKIAKENGVINTNLMVRSQLIEALNNIPGLRINVSEILTDRQLKTVARDFGIKDYKSMTRNQLNEVLGNRSELIIEIPHETEEERNYEKEGAKPKRKRKLAPTFIKPKKRLKQNFNWGNYSFRVMNKDEFSKKLEELTNENIIKINNRQTKTKRKVTISDSVRDELEEKTKKKHKEKKNI